MPRRASAYVLLGAILAVSAVAAAPTTAAGAAASGTTTPSSLVAVSCPTLTVCVAVGTQGGSRTSALVERWDGQRWRVEPTPSSGATDTTLTAVSCSSPVACTAVGYTQPGLGPAYPGTLLAERWNGSSWARQTITQPAGSDVGANATGVSCPAADRCVAVGFYTVDGTGEHTLAADWNGTSWSLQSFSGYSADLLSVSCASTTYCVGAGNFGGQTASDRWTGTIWASQHPPNPTTPEPGDGLTGVGCTRAPSVNCQMVGVESTGDLSQATFGVGWDTTAWTLESTPSPGEAASLSAVSCAGTPRPASRWGVTRCGVRTPCRSSRAGTGRRGRPRTARRCGARWTASRVPPRPPAPRSG